MAFSGSNLDGKPLPAEFQYYNRRCLKLKKGNLTQGSLRINCTIFDEQRRNPLKRLTRPVTNQKQSRWDDS